MDMDRHKKNLTRLLPPRAHFCLALLVPQQLLQNLKEERDALPPPRGICHAPDARCHPEPPELICLGVLGFKVFGN